MEVLARCFVVEDGTHILAACPAQRHADESRAVAITPAHVGGSFLMWHKAEVGRWIFVAKRRDGWCQLHQARYSAACFAAQLSVGTKRGVDTILHQAHVDV